MKPFAHAFVALVALALATPAFGRRLFLPKEEVTVRVNTGSSVAYPEVFRRFGYPLTDGILERRHKLLRAVLVEHGFRIA